VEKLAEAEHEASKPNVVWLDEIEFVLRTHIEFGAQCAPNLTWSHYRLIMRLTDKNAMQYYLYGSFCLLEKSILSRKGGTAKEKSV